MNLLNKLLTLIALNLLGVTPASAQQPHTARTGSAERTQILDAIRPSPGSNIRFIVHELRVIPGKTATYAYAAVEPSKQEYDGGEFLLKNTGGWRVIWSVTGGGTDDCSTAADYYASALALLTAEGIAPDALSPQLHKEYLRLKAFAAEELECTAIGDLGPELPHAADKQDDLDARTAQTRPRILMHPRFPSPITNADLDGDGKPDLVSIIHILPGGAGRIVAPELIIANPWGSNVLEQALTDEDQPMALLVEGSRSGARHLLHSPYIEISARIGSGVPVEVHHPNSRLARAFRKDCPAMRNDFLVMATEAGIDIALFWNAGRYEVCWPDETP